MLKFKKVVLGISGGVDSAVAAVLLKKRGFDVLGVFMQNWDIADEKGVCSTEEDYKDAQTVCKKLNINLHKVNFVKEYWNDVFCQLVKEYEAGLTPNPDVLCNKHIKFNLFHDYAVNTLKADAIATGHYARTNFGSYLERYDPTIGAKLFLPKDSKKDQTFFLCQIPQKALQKTMFPIGEYTKSEVKKIAQENGLEEIASKPESMGICFIGSRNFQNFIKEYVVDKKGNFVDIDTAKVVGEHSGVHQWTLGQRAKIQGMSTAYFVAKKDIENNIIYVAQGTNHPVLYTDLFCTSPPYWIHSQPYELKKGNLFNCRFKFQHTETWESCEICQTEVGLVIKLDKLKRAVTPGQYAVFSTKEECFGSAKIINSGIPQFFLNYLKNEEQIAISGIANS